MIMNITYCYQMMEVFFQLNIFEWMTRINNSSTQFISLMLLILLLLKNVINPIKVGKLLSISKMIRYKVEYDINA